MRSQHRLPKRLEMDSAASRISMVQGIVNVPHFSMHWPMATQDRRRSPLALSWGRQFGASKWLQHTVSWHVAPSTTATTTTDATLGHFLLSKCPFPIMILQEPPKESTQLHYRTCKQCFDVSITSVFEDCTIRATVSAYFHSLGCVFQTTTKKIPTTWWSPSTSVFGSVHIYIHIYCRVLRKLRIRTISLVKVLCLAS